MCDCRPAPDFEHCRSKNRVLSPLILRPLKIVLHTVCLTIFTIALCSCDNKLACKHESNTFNHGPVYADGYLRKTSVKNMDGAAQIYFRYSIEKAIYDLTPGRFLFVELELDKEKSLLGNDLQFKLYGNGNKYARLYLSEISNPACAYFSSSKNNSYLQSSFHRYGYPDNICIAVEKVDDSLSGYEIDLENKPSKYLPTGETWNQITVRNRSDRTEIAVYKYFAYGGGGVHNPGPTSSCFDSDNFQKILEQTIRPNIEKIIEK